MWLWRTGVLAWLVFAVTVVVSAVVEVPPVLAGAGLVGLVAGSVLLGACAAIDGRAIGRSPLASLGAGLRMGLGALMPW